ncbi:phosphate/phosphite/phosphonate ABC transporter substrate-binding protein [Roseovarius amoyensis]|uniref:phosphate/phosphite/phosphonate ABC transporter substrate-binding protein n=1 Tax=Roseovarius amoyensis TaxID=2211448 RepID=UPI001EF794C4|nr:PhnD/SsuA/transferrin family substrate-binding protein [Roseovarius amoyensis]
MSLASLPMYDRPEMRDAHDRLWQEIRARLGDGPETLTRGGDLWDHWLSPGLVLSQTCGLPYRTRLFGKVAKVASPDNRLPDCPPGHYFSIFVVRADDPRQDPAEFADARLAVNESVSQSGWGAPFNYARERGFAFADTMETGAHVLSAAAVAEGRADIAAIDALTWRLYQRHDPQAAELREIGRTTPTPAPPYITAITRDAAPVLAALTDAIDALTPADRDTLSLYGVVQVSDAAYQAVPNPASPAG